MIASFFATVRYDVQDVSARRSEANRVSFTASFMGDVCVVQCPGIQGASVT